MEEYSFLFRVVQWTFLDEDLVPDTSDLARRHATLAVVDLSLHDSAFLSLELVSATPHPEGSKIVVTAPGWGRGRCAETEMKTAAVGSCWLLVVQPDKPELIAWSISKRWSRADV